MPSHSIMLSPKLKWPREASCIPNSTLQPISDQRTRSALDNQDADLFLIPNAQSSITDLGPTHVTLYRQFADLFLIKNENIIILLYSNASCMVSFGYFNME